MDSAKTIYDRVWTLIALDAELSTLLRSGNRIDTASPDWATVQSNKFGGAPADHPRLRIELTEESENQRQAIRFFGQNAEGFSAGTCDYAVAVRVTLLLTLVHDSLDLTVQRRVENAINRALMKWGPKMALSFVNTFDLRWQRKTEQSRETNGKLQTVARGTLTVEARPKLSEITGVTPGESQTLPSELSGT